jgi:hypothetical protein
MTRVMARCAGFAEADATAMAEADQAADSLTYGSTTINFAERTGPNSPTFHFPEADGAVDVDGNGYLRTWALGEGTLPLEVCDANGRCCDSGTDNCVERGSLQAMGLWLHAIGDFWSHHACIQSGGMNHGMYNHADDQEDPNNEQDYYCASTMHSHEWGRRDTDPQAVMLQDNALEGLMTVRAQLEALAQSRGYTACGQVTDDDLLMFASTIGGDSRSSITSGLYSMCDAVVACGPPPMGDTTTAEPGGCASGRDVGWFSGLAVFAMFAMRRRRR